MPVEAVRLQTSAFSLVPCTAPYRTVLHRTARVLPSFSTTAVLLGHTTRKSDGAGFFLKQKLREALAHAQQYPLEMGFQCAIAAEKLSLPLGKLASVFAVGLPGCLDKDIQWHLHIPALIFM